MSTPTSIELNNAILINLKAQIDATTDEKVLQTLINEYEQITELIRDGYQFSDAALKNLPAVIRAEVQILVDAEIAKLFPVDTKSFLVNLVSGVPLELLNLKDFVGGFYNFEIFLNGGTPYHLWKISLAFSLVVTNFPNYIYHLNPVSSIKFNLTSHHRHDGNIALDIRVVDVIDSYGSLAIFLNTEYNSENVGIKIKHKRIW